MKRILFFDTETNGLPKNYNAPASDVDNWPRMIQLGFLVANESGETLMEAGQLIKPDGFEIPSNITQLTGITQEKALQEGQPIMAMLVAFQAQMMKCTHIVAHNLDFDMPVIMAEFYRMGSALLPFTHFAGIEICTMKSPEVISFCAIPASSAQRYHGQKYKWPRLQELHQKLFDSEFDGAHDALNDVRATARCFFELVETGVLAI